MKKVRPSGIPAKTVLYVFSFLISAVLISCEGIETSLERSSRRVNVYHGKEIFWQGEIVAYNKTNRYNWSLENRIKSILRKKGIWKDGIIKASNGRHGTMSLHDIHTIYDSDHRAQCYLFTLDIPYTSVKKYVYIISTGELSEYNRLEDVVMQNSALFGTSPSPVSKQQFDSNVVRTINELTVRSRLPVYNHLKTGTTIYHYGFSHWVPDDVDSTLKNTVVPIVMGYVDGSLAWNSVFLNVHYETDFGIKGGAVETGREAREQFNFSDSASFMLKASAGIRGVETSYLTEHYQFGNAEYDHGGTKENIKFEAKRRQFDILYHFNWKEIPALGGSGTGLEAIDRYFGYRYLNTKTLGIIYTMKQDNDSDDRSLYVVAESSPQLIESKSHMFGFGINNFTNSRRGFSMLYAFEFYAGYGYSYGKFFGYYYDDEEFSAEEVEENRTRKIGMLIFAPGGCFGCKYLTDIGGAIVELFAKYEPTIYAHSSDFGPYSKFYSNDGDIFNRITAGATLRF